jgi:hypothetical protein
MPNKDSVNYDRFPKGVDNRRSDTDMQAGSLRLGSNVDILNSGRARRRRGISQAIAAEGAHSVAAFGSRMVFATATTLELVNASFTRRTLLTDARLAKPVSFAPMNGDIYFSNEDINGKVNAADAFEPWGITPPAIAPALAAPAGVRIVQVTCTFVVANPLDATLAGEESGAPAASLVSCTDAPEILVTQIPQSADARVKWTRLYVTDLDGTVFYQQVDVPAGRTTYTIRSPLALGQQLLTQFMAPPPPGHALTACLGRIYIASGNLVIHTQPLRCGLMDPEADYFMYPERVRMVKAVQDGVFVGSRETHFLSGVGTDARSTPTVLPYGAIEGSAIDLPNSEDVMWLSERGFIRGSNGGGVKNLTEGQVAMSRYTRAAMGVMEYDGHKAVIAVTRGGDPNPAVAKDYVAAEAKRIAELE